LTSQRLSVAASRTNEFIIAYLSSQGAMKLDEILKKPDAEALDMLTKIVLGKSTFTEIEWSFWKNEAEKWLVAKRTEGIGVSGRRTKRRRTVLSLTDGSSAPVLELDK
jgi:hypothetical protein